MNQTLKSALVAATVSVAVATSAADAGTYSLVDHRQDTQIATLQQRVRLLTARVKGDEADIRYAFTSMQQLQCEIEHGANAAVCA